MRLLGGISCRNHRGEHRRAGCAEQEKGEETMRKYKENGQLETLCCNMCGKKMAVKDGILREGAASFDLSWGYFSEKDGEVHHFDLCEECYDRLIAEFPIPVDREERLEYL